MLITISENVRKLRLENNLTQEQLAETIGVTPQAVSRWETGNSYPDITLLPVLANLFGTSIDALLGADMNMRKHQIDDILSHNKQLHREGRYAESIDYLSEQIKHFPDSADITFQLAHSLEKKLCTLGNADEAAKLSDDILLLCKRAIKLDTDSTWITAACRQCMCFTYFKQGKREAAIEIARSMPTWWVSSENLLPYVLEVEDGAKQRQHNLLSLMDMMILHLQKIARDMKTPEESIAVLDKAVALAKLISGDDHKFYDERVFGCHVWRARYFCDRLHDNDSTFAALEKALFHADRYEKRPEKSQYNAFWLYRIQDEKSAVEKDSPKNLYTLLIEFLAEPVFEVLKADARHDELLRKISELTN